MWVQHVCTIVCMYVLRIRANMYVLPHHKPAVTTVQLTDHMYYVVSFLPHHCKRNDTPLADNTLFLLIDMLHGMNCRLRRWINLCLMLPERLETSFKQKTLCANFLHLQQRWFPSVLCAGALQREPAAHWCVGSIVMLIRYLLCSVRETDHFY